MRLERANFRGARLSGLHSSFALELLGNGTAANNIYLPPLPLITLIKNAYDLKLTLLRASESAVFKMSWAGA